MKSKKFQDLWDEFLSTPEEAHYLIGGFLAGVLVGMWLALLYVGIARWI
jgi:hypothetical protein